MDLEGEPRMPVSSIASVSDNTYHVGSSWPAVRMVSVPQWAEMNYECAAMKGLFRL